MNRSYQDLANAVVTQAAKDYKYYHKRIEKNPADDYAKHEVREIEAFFGSKWMKRLINIDGAEILARIKGELEHERELD